MNVKQLLLAFPLAIIPTTTLLSAERPNIVILFADDLGYSDLGCFGGEIHTPNLDKLAQEGVRLTQFMNSSKSAPSRASLLTGLNSVELGTDGPPAVMRHSLTIAELLQAESNYHTLMAGKWHSQENPTDRGFDHYYGIKDGYSNYFTLSPNKPLMKDGVKLDPNKLENPEDFHTTDFYTDRALEYIEEYGDEKDPYFLIVTYNAPHYPLQASSEDLAKYRGKYMKGWDKLRLERFNRQKELGILPKDATLTIRDKRIPSWDSYKTKDAADMTMATYASMVDRLDRNIGRILDKIEQSGEADNTLILFFSDNGACAEGNMWNGESESKRPGTKTSQARLGMPWANACNTPFRAYKRDLLNGGQCSPFIARWGNGIKDKGAIYHQEAHIIDIYPTIAELAGVKYPEGKMWPLQPKKGGENMDKWEIAPIHGVSMLPLLSKGKTLEREKPLAGCFKGNCFIRKDGWKLVTNWADNHKGLVSPQEWYLFNIKSDPSESKDLAAKYPDKYNELKAAYFEWFKEANAIGGAYKEDGVTPHSKGGKKVKATLNKEK